MAGNTLSSLLTHLENSKKSFHSEWRNYHANFPHTLWHYTNAQGLLGILQNNELWFSDPSFLNDPSEMSYAVELTERVVGERLNDTTTSPLEKEYLEVFLKRIINQRDNIKDYSMTYTFICCFCEDADSLNLWRAYSDHGRGYSIGVFSHHIVRKLGTIRLVSRTIINDKLDESWNPLTAYLCRVIYKEQEQRKLIDDLLNRLVQAIKYVPLEFPLGDANNTHKVIVSHRMSQLFNLFLVCFKHPTFEVEKEWRMIYAPPYSNDDTNSGSASPAELHYRLSSSYFVPYLKVDVSRDKDVEHEGKMITMKKLVIEQIFAGPGLDARLARASFNAFALRNGYLGYNVDILPSNVPFRSL